MKTPVRMLLILLAILPGWIPSPAQQPIHSLVGYWQNWNDGACPWFDLSGINHRYSVINVAFAMPATGTDYDMQFTPVGLTQAEFQAQVAALQDLGKTVAISIGGATTTVKLDDTTERNLFVSSMLNIINTYGFDGLDIDLEGSSLSITGGTITNPIDPPVIHLIEAIKQIMAAYHQAHGKKLYLGMAPETAYVQGGMSGWGGLWGAYLPVIHALRDSLDILYVQLYNSGSMYGVDTNIYTQGTADFIVSQTEAVLYGFNTGGGFFNPLMPEQVAVGLPACPLAAGGGFVDTLPVKQALDYLLGKGPKPGTYTLRRPAGYPSLRGMMTWSVNWDKVTTCGSEWEFAVNYQRIFPLGLPVIPHDSPLAGWKLFPNPASHTLTVILPAETTGSCLLTLFDQTGRTILQQATEASGNNGIRAQEVTLDVSSLPEGFYLLRCNTASGILNHKVMVTH